MSEIQKAGIEFTADEAKKMIKIIDAFVKIHGIKVAGDALYFAGKFIKAFEPKQIEQVKSVPEVAA